MTTSFNFASALLNWFDIHGRKDLPWQQNPTPYHVWLSEIMLQQTQVATVIAYYQRFIEKFPNIESLANAHQDDVLAMWSGLGYYARARNLHKTAQIVTEQYQGKMPAELDDLIDLPGIGRSTAGAILTLAYKKQFPILDGNVKRVLCRFFAIDGWPGQKSTEKQLWQLAESLLPADRIDNYIQAQMDLGATVCSRNKPACEHCPLASACQANLTGQQSAYPYRKPTKKSPEKEVQWLVFQNEEQKLLFEQRPPSGIWGGLWSFPEVATTTDLQDYCHKLSLSTTQLKKLTPIRHIFTHFRLTIYPVLITCHESNAINEPNRKWYKIDEATGMGLPTPVKNFLDSFHRDHNDTNS